MDDKNELLHVLKKDMEEQSELIINQINYEIHAMEEKQIQIYEEGLKKEVESFKERELNDLKKLAATLSSQSKLKIQRELLQYREKLVEDLFVEAKKRINKFVTGNEYREFLKKQLSDIKVQNGIFYVRLEDIEIMRDVLSEAKFNAEVQSENIQLGGFRYVQQEERLEIDSTLDQKLENQRRWFESQSGLIV